MKNLFRCIGLISILLFSFYYTEKVSDIVINNSYLVSEINKVKENYEIEAVSAEITDEYIVPGIVGSNVNVLQSYNNMKSLNVFNEYYLVYDKVYPNISLENNKEKIIKSGNKQKNAVAIIVQDNEDILKYSQEKKIKLTRLTIYETFNKESFFEQINNDIHNYQKLEKLLDINNLNTNICYLKDDINEYCSKKYKVIETVNLNKLNVGNIIKSVSSGYIILISNNVSLTDYKLLLKQIYYQNLNVVPLSSLISEERIK